MSNNHAGNLIAGHRTFEEGNGTTFYGEKGWISLGRRSAAASDPEWNKILNDFPKDENGYMKSDNNMHGANFIKVIKGEMAPFAPLDEAIISDCVSHIGNISIRLGKELHWNPEKGRITNLPEANKHFNREIREPYSL